jgi:hypothetical protein
MSINYTSVIGVGVAEDDITYQALTEQSKNIVKAAYLDSLPEEETYDEDGDRISNEDLLDDVDLEEWFSENIYEYDLFYELGLENNTGNYFTGEKGYRGIEVNLNSIEGCKAEFRKIVDLEPEVFNGVLVW